MNRHADTDNSAFSSAACSCSKETDTGTGLFPAIKTVPFISERKRRSVYMKAAACFPEGQKETGLFTLTAGILCNRLYGWTLKSEEILKIGLENLASAVTGKDASGLLPLEMKTVYTSDPAAPVLRQQKNNGEILQNSLFETEEPAKTDRISIPGSVFKDLQRVVQDSFSFGDARSALLSTGEQKECGCFYTPRDLSFLLAEAVCYRDEWNRPADQSETAENRLIPEVLDPACGGGNLLLAVLMLLQKRGFDSKEIIPHLHGCDTDPAAVLAARCAVVFSARDTVIPGNICTGDLLSISKTDSDRFDAVIMNPPYLGHKALTELKTSLDPRFREVFSDKSDCSYCFYKLAQEQLRSGGVLAVLSSRYFMEADSAASLREFLISHFTITHIIDFYGQRLKEWPGIDPLIMTAIKKTFPDSMPHISYKNSAKETRVLVTRPDYIPVQAVSSVHAVHSIRRALALSGSDELQKRSQQENSNCAGSASLLYDQPGDPISEKIPFLTFESTLSNENTLTCESTPAGKKTLPAGNIPSVRATAVPVWHPLSPEEQLILETAAKISRSYGKCLGDVCESFQGIISGCDAAFVRGKDHPDCKTMTGYLRPWIKSTGVLRDRIDGAQGRLFYIGRADKPDPDQIAVLEPYRSRLEKRRETRNGRIPWYALQWERNPESFIGVKIVWPYKADRSAFRVDRSGAFFSADIYGMTVKDTHWDPDLLAALLNTPFYDRYYKCIGKKLGFSQYEYYPNTVMRLQLPDPDILRGAIDRNREAVVDNFSCCDIINYRGQSGSQKTEAQQLQHELQLALDRLARQP
ncbi:MAG: N-6 DNA methylase [Eubacteriaceae bacterium]|jgi:tRNA1(Val) A37 N6-methylase TrmN6